jgi:hypothetical protein
LEGGIFSQFKARKLQVPSHVQVRTAELAAAQMLGQMLQDLPQNL